jgi:hypothetical protein
MNARQRSWTGKEQLISSFQDVLRKELAPVSRNTDEFRQDEWRRYAVGRRNDEMEKYREEPSDYQRGKKKESTTLSFKKFFDVHLLKFTLKNKEPRQVWMSAT